MYDADVLIVGAGPTGLMLAGELQLAGASTIVVDRLKEPIKQSRALGFSARTIEEFDQRGLLPRFGELNTIPFGHFGGMPIDYRILEGGSYGARGKPQSLTEAVLAGWSGELGAVVHRGYEVIGLEPDDDGVGVDLVTPEGPLRLRARYVAGCDGGRSTVRKLIGVDFPGTEPTIEMWFADVAGVELRPRFSGERVPGGMVMVLPMGPVVNRVVVYEPNMKRSGDAEPTFEEVAAAWNRLTGEDISGGKPLWTSWTTDSSRAAAQYRNDRVFLLGDAAHIHLPTGAQGMSAGIGDAMNLGWKLASALRGTADLLDTYHSERHPVAERILANTLAQRILYLSGDEMDPMRELFAELLSFEEVQRHLVGMVTGLDIRYDVGSGSHPLLGRRLPNVSLAGKPAFEYLHAGHGVLFGSDQVPAGWRDRVDAAPGELPEIGTALVRPDGYIAWIGSDDAGLADALTRWFGPAAYDKRK
jgi:bifunctional hydroxylase/dehydrase